MTKKTYREEFNRITDGCSAIFCFGLLAHAMGLSEYHAIDIVKNAKEEHYQKAIRLYKSMMSEEVTTDSYEQENKNQPPSHSG